MLVDNILNLNVCLNRNLSIVFHIDNIVTTDIFGTNSYYCKVVISGAFLKAHPCNISYLNLNEQLKCHYNIKCRDQVGYKQLY